TLDRQISPSDESHSPDEGRQSVFQQHRNRVGPAHTGTSGGGLPSIGSDNEPPGGIIGNTLASCSMVNSINAGPGSAVAARTESSSCSRDSTRQPAMPYASASRT